MNKNYFRLYFRASKKSQISWVTMMRRKAWAKWANSWFSNRQVSAIVDEMVEELLPRFSHVHFITPFFPTLQVVIGVVKWCGCCPSPLIPVDIIAMHHHGFLPLHAFYQQANSSFAKNSRPATIYILKLAIFSCTSFLFVSILFFTSLICPLTFLIPVSMRFKPFAFVWRECWTIAQTNNEALSRIESEITQVKSELESKMETNTKEVD